MKIVTRMIEDEVYESVTQDGITDIIDMRALGLKKNMSPVESVLSAVAACGAVDIVAILKKRRKTIAEFTMQTEGTRRENPPRSFTAINIHYKIVSPDISEEELFKAAQLSIEKYCSVADSLKAKITISASVTQP